MKLSDLDAFQRISMRIEEIQGITDRFEPRNKGISEVAKNENSKELSNFKDQLDAKFQELTMEENIPNSQALSEIIRKESSKNHLDPNLVKSVIRAESGFKPSAVSSKGAMGLMQLMPGTADLLGVDNPFDPEENIAGGTKFLGDLMKKFGDTNLALAAYNAGPGAVQKYDGIPPYKETQDYVKKVNRFWKGNK
ncbi:lytic transglycosylase domain-containing protein [Leptospira wolffii]|uniref:Lytic transglycosylase n=1 Tax=Leptospira wolffii TaxID=409998 RepID=A0A2M9ZCG7_9LEPT|nr:lytic transglycosylase domain-containing protein [Leptospira wolffii]PJZ66027.1 lytic transglycosylase [Leptospira wolffii]TGK59246.1 lytic transglycosylase domain-containing protein [Leptospira wolffii]TGK71079.1 lytic transglycosylase domain-containing protein [Leptospira wolffii]TGK71373.1 lytic transglycosylase domain-containing protein [Leptospira wolffii]TGL29350.1 lytic transglycosylase domain-containing protein [Leptospira wolffii]